MRPLNNKRTSVDTLYLGHDDFSVPTGDMLYPLTTNPNLDKDVDTLTLVCILTTYLEIFSDHRLILNVNT